MTEDRLKLAVFIDFDNIQIGIKDTLGKDFDVSLVLEALKERGDVVTKVAYADWHLAGDQSRPMTQHAVQMVQRNVTPRGDKNGADINLALDALEMAFNRPHINAFAIISGDSDYIPLVEKLKQYDKRVLVVGGRAFTSNILQRNCHEFIAYENLLKSGAAGGGSRVPGSARRGRTATRTSETRPLTEALPNVQRALKILAEREVAPQLGLLKTTLLQLDATFSERDFGAGSFLEFMQKIEREGSVLLARTERGYLVELPEGGGRESSEREESGGESESAAPVTSTATRGPIVPGRTPAESAAAMDTLKASLAVAREKSPHRPLYMRQVRQALHVQNEDFDERRYGFRGLLDLLHHAQREGLVHLQRDRKGVWRIFPTVAGSTEAPAGAPTAASAETTAPLADKSTLSEELPIQEAPPESQSVSALGLEGMAVPTLEIRPTEASHEATSECGPLPAAKELPAESPTQEKARKSRRARASTRGGRSGPSRRHKPKDQTQD